MSPDHMAALRTDLDAFADCLSTGDLDAPIAHCGDWTLYELANHLGRGSLWAAAAITEKRPDHRSPRAPRERAELVPWFEASVAVLLAALDRDPATEAWTFFPPSTVAFWRRRRCQETLVHRWDAENALDRSPVIDPALADDGVAEVLDGMRPFLLASGRTTAAEQSVRLVATDTGSVWTLGPGEPVATLSASAADLLLLLWQRRSPDDAAITWSGDVAAGRAVLDHPVTP